MALKGPRGEIDVALIDLDDTLVPWQTLSHWQWAWRPQGPILSERRMRSAVKRSMQAWDRRRWQGLRGSQPPADVTTLREHLKGTLELLAGHPVPSAEADPVIARFLHSAGEIEMFPDVPEFLSFLERGAVRVGVTTSLPGEAARWALKRIGLSDSLLVSTGDDGQTPPMPTVAAFRRAAERLGAKPRTALFLGDLFWSDVRAAARAGLYPILIDRAELWPTASVPRAPSLARVPAEMARSIESSPDETEAEP